MSESLSPRSRPVLADLGPLAQLRAGRLGRRFAQLFVGLLLYGMSMAMMLRGGFGVAPWDVLHTGFIRHVPLTLGQTMILFSFVALLAWIPLRETPGVATIANAIMVGLATDATLAVLHQPDGIAARAGLMTAGVALNGFATAVYIGAQLGRGPRDGLMTGLHRRTGYSIRAVRTALEVAVVVVGIALGGLLGIGTVVYALTIGPVTQAVLPWVMVKLD